MSYVTTSPPIVDVTTRKLFAHLWRGGPFAYYWTASEAKRQDKPKEAIEKRSFWFATDDPGPLPDDNGSAGPRHLYFSVNPTQARGSEYQRAKRDARPVAAINTLFGEFDYKDFASPAAAVAHVESLHPKPSVIISSGGGLHCYWLLTQPFILSGDGQYNRAKNAQYAWVDYVKSDGDAKDLNRVLRIPGSLNYKPKYGPDFPMVTILRADFDRLYSLRELEQLCQPRQIQPKPRRDNRISDWTTDLHTAADCLKRLQKWRVEQYQPWLEVGMSLKAFGDAGLKLWDEWSQGSKKYDRDECESKWATFAADGLGLGSLIHWANEDDPKPKAARRSPKPSQPPQPGPKELERRAQRDKYMLQAIERRQELEGRKTAHYHPDLIPFELAPDEYEAKVYQARQTFSSAAAWREHVLFEFPELDPDHEYRVKLEENREHKMSFCGRPFKRLTATGEIKTGRIMCGLCESCKKLDRQNLKQALEKAIFDDPDNCLMVVTVACKAERAGITRRLRENDMADKVFPVADESAPLYDILLPSAAAHLVADYDPVELLIVHLNDARLDRWLETPEGERQSGKLIPSRRKLREIGEPDRFECDPGPGTFELDLPGIVCEGELPEVYYDGEVHDPQTLQRALNEMADRQRRIMWGKSHVILGVITKKSFYSLNDVSAICQLFNAGNEERRAKKAAQKSRAKGEKSAQNAVGPALPPGMLPKTLLDQEIESAWGYR